MQRNLWVAVLATGAAHAALAQPASASAAATATPSTIVAVAPYRSAFENFRPWNDEAPQDWRRVNSEMEQLGGHVGHLRPAPSTDKPGGAMGGHMMPGMPMHGSPAASSDRTKPGGQMMRETPMQGGAMPVGPQEKKQ